MMPYLMVYRPVDSVEKHFVADGWTYHDIQRMVRYYNQPSVWMSCSWKEYIKGADRIGIRGLLV